MDPPLRPLVPLLLAAAAMLISALLPSRLDAGPRRLRLATTTSTDNSGLLAELLPHFEADSGLEVDVIAVGTGKALALGARGDVDVLLVHAPEAEERFVAAGYGVQRRAVMYNDFVILGPTADPAGIRGLADAAEAFGRVARAGVPFVSRGDDSGTHKKERSLWAAAGIEPGSGRGEWYLEAGQGMGAVIMMAEQMQAYTLADRGTYLSFQEGLTLRVLVAGDERLFNPYGVIAVNPERFPHVNYQGARRFVEWITGPEGQALIGGFRVQGQQLFHPGAAGGDAAGGPEVPGEPNGASREAGR